MHRIHWDGPLPVEGTAATVGEDEAAHALRVKRMRIGEAVELLDGSGGVARGRVESVAGGGGGRRGGLVVRVTEVAHVGEVQPRVEVWAATPKGSRVDEMVEGLSEVGAAAWIPLRAERSVVEPRMTKLDRLSRLAVESAKQCGRAWFLRIEQERTLADAVAKADGTLVIVADASGTGVGEVEEGHAALVRVVIGPEGGWATEELAIAREAGAMVARFGPHSMRVETAAVAAAAVVINRFGAGRD